MYVGFGKAPMYRLVCATHKQLAQHMGPNHHGILWLVGSGYHKPKFPMPDADLAAAGCTREEWGVASRGILSSTKAIPTTASPEPGGRLPAAWREEYTRRVPAYNTVERPTTATPFPYAAQNYDGVWMFALAFDKMLKGTATTSAVPLSKLTFPEAGVAGVLKTHLLNTNFDGASGRVTIKSETQDRGSSTFHIVQMSSSAKEGTRSFASYSQAGNTFETKAFNVNGVAGFNITWPTPDGAQPKEPQVFTRQPPQLYSASPSVVSPQGGEVSIIGAAFLPGIITVIIAEKICSSPVFKSSTLIVCNAPKGVGGPHFVVVSCDGLTSSPRRLVSYNLPNIYDVSKKWVTDGSLLRVTGSFFVPRMTKCRIASHPESFATVIDTSHIECVFSFPNATADRDGKLGTLEVSNDDGQRWVSGATLNLPIEWGGGTTTPVSPRTINYVAEVVIGGIVPTDRYSGEKGRQYIKAISLAYKMAAEAANMANPFPGNIKLRVEILTVDPGGSGTPKTATEVATAFAKQGVATNASTEVGVHDSSKCIEFGYPVPDEWQGDPGCCSVYAKAGCSGGYNKVKGTVCGSGSWGVAHETKCEATAKAHPLFNVIGIAGAYWSSNSIPVARAVSTPFKLPMIAYESWSSELDSAAKFPYFLRVSPANSDMSKVVGAFLRSMSWMDIGIVTDDAPFSSDYGKGVANDMKEQGGTVLYHGIYSKLPTQAANKQGQLHKMGVKNISSHLVRAREKGVRILFVAAKGDAGKIALYDALNDAGFLGEGYAVFDGQMMTLSNEYIATGQQRVNGIVHISVGAAHECKAATCPHEACGSTCAAPAREMNQAFDAMYTLASAIAPLFKDGGSSYMSGAEETRMAAMTAIRTTSLSSSVAASGIVQFSDAGINKRDKWNFGCVLMQ